MARTEAQAMLRVARRDLRAARLRAVDEAVKAWILSRDRKVPFTHDIAELLQILGEQGVDPSPYLQFSQFTLFAIQLRYDDEPEQLEGLGDALLDFQGPADLEHWLSRIETT